MAQRASLTGGPLLSRHQQFQRDPQNLPRQHPQLTQLHPRSPLLLPVGAGAVAYPSSSSPINPPFAGHHHRQPSSPLAAAPLSLSHTPPPPPAHGRSNSNIGVGSGNASCDPPVSRRRDSQAELVSPVSETFSSRPTPAPSEPELADRLRIPPPIGKSPCLIHRSLSPIVETKPSILDCCWLHPHAHRTNPFAHLFAVPPPAADCDRRRDSIDENPIADRLRTKTARL